MASKALTPLIADSLTDLEETYSPEWLEEAIQVAVAYNKRSLKYIEAILNRWQTEGRSADRRRNGDDWRRFFAGKYGNEVE